MFRDVYLGDKTKKKSKDAILEKSLLCLHLYICVWGHWLGGGTWKASRVVGKSLPPDLEDSNKGVCFH